MYILWFKSFIKFLQQTKRPSAPNMHSNKDIESPEW